jgi:spoIIIJ-associated protein
MSLDKKDYYGKDVAEAIKRACDSLDVPQETLEIEVVETGSTGIFGLIRKKAHIRVAIRPAIEEVENIFDFASTSGADSTVDESQPSENFDLLPDDGAILPTAAHDEEDDEEEEVPVEMEQESDAKPESLAIVREELLRLVELMGFPSTLEIQVSGLAVICTLQGEFEENLTGPEGKVLDSLQYILRKIVSRKVPERLRISINVGAFREKRIEELKVKAAELAALVKEDGKTQVLPGLNPSERRIIHMFFQEDKEIRSRSVGDGLFKKILIYKPGKGSRPGGRKRSPGKGRQGKNGSKQNRES